LGGIFISYRRNDDGHAAGRLYDCLVQHFSPEQVFINVDNIPAGLDFVGVVREKVTAWESFW
jgi:hypothetical protein